MEGKMRTNYAFRNTDNSQMNELTNVTHPQLNLLRAMLVDETLKDRWRRSRSEGSYAAAE